MERKIGEIFEYNGEWLQCVEQPKKYDKTVCALCAFQGNGNCELDRCSGTYRSDKKFVIFKKLEKVGEPYSDYCPSGRVIYFQKYKCYQKPIYTGDIVYWADDIHISLEIKQTKEDMEEKKLNLKPFDIQKAREGKPVCTRDGRKARIICFDAKGDKPIIALVEMGTAETPNNYPIDGKAVSAKEASCDLMMLPEKKEGWVNVYKMKESTFGYITSYFDTEENAKEDKEQLTGYVATVKINWEE